MKSVDLQGVPARPVPKEMLDKIGCTLCADASARWELASGKDVARSFACSKCFLYCVLEAQRGGVEAIIRGVEEIRHTVFAREETGRLLRPEDADRVASGVVLGYRVLQARAAMGGMRAGTGR